MHEEFPRPSAETPPRPESKREVSSRTTIELIKDISRLELQYFNIEITRPISDYIDRHPDQMTPELDKILSRIFASTLQFQKKLQSTLQQRLDIDDELWDVGKDEYLSSGDPNLSVMQR